MWIDLTEYALRHRTSLSTLRRRIKTNAIKFKMQRGKYLLWTDDANAMSAEIPSPEKQVLEKRIVEVGISDPRDKRIGELENRIAHLQRQNEELESLVKMFDK